MVELHLLADLLQLVVAQQHGSSRVVHCETGHVKHVVFEDEQGFAGGLGVLLDFVVTFETQVGGVVVLPHNYYYTLLPSQFIHPIRIPVAVQSKCRGG